ncbi:MAG: integrin alpha [Thermoanaerobaculia bacterium]
MRSATRSVLPVVLALSALPAAAQLTGIGATLWSQASPGIDGDPVSDDRLGGATVSGDFDGDGYADVACSALLDGTPRSGSVHVLYGGPAGLSSVGSQVWRQDTPGVPGESEEEDLFGWSLAVGDFDGDAFDDLAIGIVEDLGFRFERPGAVLVLYGSANGLTASGAQVWDEDTYDVLDDHSRFGEALAAADFDDDGFDELAIGIPGLAIDAEAEAGVVVIFRGSPSGLTADLSPVLHQGLPSVQDDAEAGDRFGFSLTAGYYDDDTAADLVVGVPYEDFDGLVDAGIVQVFYGSVGGLGFSDGEIWHQDVAGVNGTAETDDRFGTALASGDPYGRGIDALVVGVSNEAIGAEAAAGAVHVLFGGPSGLTATGSLLYFQGSPSIPGTATAGARFGYTLAFGDFDGDFREDLAIGARGEIVGGNASAGAVTVLYGSPVGLGLGEAEVWTQDSTGVPGTAEVLDLFSYSLAAGDFAADGSTDLAVGVLLDEVAAVRAGSFNVLQGLALFRDGFESGDTSAWTTTVQ